MRVAFTTKDNCFVVEEFDSLKYNKDTQEAMFYNKLTEYNCCIYIRMKYDASYDNLANEVLSYGYINLDNGYSYEYWDRL